MNPDLRRSILERDGHLCQLCREAPATEVDHIVPRVRGGSDDPANLQAACRWCNAQKNAGDAPRQPTTPLAASVMAKRRALRLSQARLAAKSGLSTSTIIRVERGHNPLVRNLIAIATALESSPVDLLDGAAA